MRTNASAKQQRWDENECHIKVHKGPVGVPRTCVSQAIQGAGNCACGDNGVGQSHTLCQAEPHHDVE